MTLCAVAAEFTALDGASIVLVSDSAGLTPLCQSSEVAGALLELELFLGEGPTLDASHGDAAEDVDLARIDAQVVPLSRRGRRPRRAGRLGVPVRVGAIRFGALCIFTVPSSAALMLDPSLRTPT